MELLIVLIEFLAEILVWLAVAVFADLFVRATGFSRQPDSFWRYAALLVIAAFVGVLSFAVWPGVAIEYRPAGIAVVAFGPLGLAWGFQRLANLSVVCGASDS